MRNRCSNPKNPQYKDYGARGIRVSDAWSESFHAFIADMGRRPDGMTLERNDNNGNYCKENCRWATRFDQSRNTSVNVWVDVCGERMVFEDAIRLIRVPRSTAFAIIQLGGRTHQEAVDFYIRKRGYPSLKSMAEAPVEACTA